MTVSDVLYLILFVASVVLLMITTGQRMVALTEQRKAWIQIPAVVVVLLLLGYWIGGSSHLKDGPITGMAAFGMAAAIFVIASLFMTQTPREQESTRESEQEKTKLIFFSLKVGLVLGVVVAALMNYLAKDEELQSFALAMPFFVSVASMLVMTGFKYPGFGAMLLVMTILSIGVFFGIRYFEVQKDDDRQRIRRPIEAFEGSEWEKIELTP